MNEISEIFPYLFPVIFVGMWIMICKLLSSMSGWASLANHYAGNRNDTSTTTWYMQSAKIGFVNYSSSLTVAASRRHLFLRILFPFKVGHPNISVPLEEIIGEERKGRIFHYVFLHFKREPGVEIQIFKRLADKIEKASGGNWNYKRL